jgi:hypothetical protein
MKMRNLILLIAILLFSNNAFTQTKPEQAQQKLPDVKTLLFS